MDINEVIDNYCEAADDYNLSDEQKLRYFHNVLERETKRFYCTPVVLTTFTLHLSVQRMLEKFNSITRQSLVCQLLKNLRLSQILSTKNCSVSDAVEEQGENITRYTPQGLLRIDPLLIRLRTSTIP